MKTYHERSECVSEKIKLLQKQRAKRRNIITTTGLLLAVTVLALVLFVPYHTAPPDVSEYEDSPYYSLIRKINAATYEKPKYKNNFEYLTSKLVWTTDNSGLVVMEPEENLAAPDMSGGAAIDGTNGGNAYVEVTDNQVSGVTEADIIKRSDRYIFYLRDFRLYVYSIAGLDSEQVGIFNLNNDPNMQFYGEAEMYLSTDCTTVTVIHSGVDVENQKKAYVVVRNLDVSDPENIHQSAIIYITGSAVSSRVVDGQLLLISNFRINNNDTDFGDESTFLPQLGSLPGELEPVSADKIIAPETLYSPRYTVITCLDGKTLEQLDTAAFLSYSDELYVSREHIFATRAYTEQGGNYVSCVMTEISCIGYGGGVLEYQGSALVEGSVKNQYSMDEYEGILRVVTSVQNLIREKEEFGDNVIGKRIRNASLYCISLEDFSIAAKVENFAPEGEQAESVRFDADTAYVCTAEVITLTDPVYFFDLSDLNNITWKDTGTIDGYSSSLVNFGDGFLLGIGFGADRNLKIEVYEESETGVVSVCDFEMNASFSSDYKSYLIDREMGLIGLCVNGWRDGNTQYLLLRFDGYQLTVVEKVPIEGSLEYVRGVLVDGFLYVFGHFFEQYFTVTEVW